MSLNQYVSIALLPQRVVSYLLIIFSPIIILCIILYVVYGFHKLDREYKLTHPPEYFENKINQLNDDLTRLNNLRHECFRQDSDCQALDSVIESTVQELNKINKDYKYYYKRHYHIFNKKKALNEPFFTRLLCQIQPHIHS